MTNFFIKGSEMGYKTAKNHPGIQYRESDKCKVNGRPDKCFYIRYKLNGKTKREKVGWQSEGYTIQVAAEIRAQRMKDIRHGKTVLTQAEINREKQRHNRTLGEVSELYFNSEHFLSLKGQYTDRNRWEKHLTFLNEKRVPELTVLDIERIKRNMKDRAPATIKHALSLLVRVINHGAEHGYCPRLHFKVKMPRVDNQVTEYLTTEQAQSLLKVLDEWPSQDVARMVKVAMFSGLRRGELFKLKRQNIDFTYKIITLENAKSGRNETIPMNPIVEGLLREQLSWVDRHHPGSPYVFPGRDGGLRVECTAIRRIKKAAGLPKKFRPFHGLRHHFAVQLASSGQFTLDMIGQFLTHKDPTVTQRYAHFLPEAQQKAAEKAAEILTQQVQRPAEVVSLDKRRHKT